MAENDLSSSSKSRRMPGARGMGGLLIVGFLVIVTILVTDKNLMNDFGTFTGSGYYTYFIHWYGLLAVGIVDVIGGLILIARPSRLNLGLGFAWSVFMVAFLLGDTLLYSQVGFSSMSQFSTYLFGLSKYPGSESYYPGLYDVLVGIFALGILYSGIDLALHRRKKAQ